MLLVTQDTFYNGLTLRHQDTINAAAGGTFMKRRPEECYDLIENMTAHHNDWDTSAQRGESSRSTTSSSPEIAALAQQMAELTKNVLRMSQSNQQVNVVNPSCETCGGPHQHFECQAAGGFTQGDVYATTGTYNAGRNSYQPQGNHMIAYDAKFQLLANQMTKMEKAFNERPQGELPSNTIPNHRKDVKIITTQSGMTLARPSVPPPNPSFSSKEVERDPETTMDQVHISSSESTAQVPSSVVQPSPVDQVQVGKFTFPADFVVVNYDVDPRVPLILGRPYLRTARALVDVHEEELTLRVGDEKLIFNVESILKYPRKHGDESINKIDILDTTCEDYFHEVLNVQ
ncbi:reverse transcriptase domain-containing protein [Tanacetum coccineum]